VSHIVGLGKACEIAKRDFDENVKNMAEMKKRLYKGLKKSLGNHVHPNVAGEEVLPNTLSMSFDHIESHALVSILSGDLMISAGSACHADTVEISSVLKAMKINLSAAAGTVRISTGKYTTNQEIDRAVELITDAVLNTLNK
jgi:cysteine desulfurase